MTTILARPRLDELPELDDFALELTWAHVDDVFVRPVTVSATVVGWLSIVIVCDDQGMFGPRPVPWILPLRTTEAEARDQARIVLEALLQARRDVLVGVPEDVPPTPAVARAIAELYGRVREEWTERRNEFVAHAHALERGRRVLADTVPDAVVAWGAEVRSTRKRWGWTQRELARRVGIDTPRLSKIENGKLDPPRLMTLRLCRALDLDPPDDFDG
jgi:DNA-binding XRE family transcriptional regulator